MSLHRSAIFGSVVETGSSVKKRGKVRRNNERKSGKVSGWVEGWVARF